MNLKESLLSKYNNEVERVGFILLDGTIVEVDNVCEDTANGFDVSGADIVKYGALADSTWHTHPNADFNLSANDYEMFRNWPEMSHYIIGNNGVRQYTIEDGEVLIAT